MPSYNQMYLISKDEYDSQKQTCAEHDHLIDSIKGNINGGQVNHIELSEGGKVVIKPTDISASVKKSNKNSISSIPKASDIIVNEKYIHPSFSSPHSRLHGHDASSRKVNEEKSSEEKIENEANRGEKRKRDQKDEKNTGEEENLPKQRKIDERIATSDPENGNLNLIQEERKIDDQVYDEVSSNENAHSSSDDPESISKRRPVPVDTHRESEILSSLNVDQDKEEEKSDELMNLLDEISELSENKSRKEKPNLGIYHREKSSYSPPENEDIQITKVINDRLKEINESGTQTSQVDPEITESGTQTSQVDPLELQSQATQTNLPTLNVYKADSSSYTPPKQYTKKIQTLKPKTRVKNTQTLLKEYESQESQTPLNENISRETQSEIGTSNVGSQTKIGTSDVGLQSELQTGNEIDRNQISEVKAKSTEEIPLSDQQNIFEKSTSPLSRSRSRSPQTKADVSVQDIVSDRLRTLRRQEQVKPSTSTQQIKSEKISPPLSRSRSRSPQTKADVSLQDVVSERLRTLRGIKENDSSTSKLKGIKKGEISKSKTIKKSSSLPKRVQEQIRNRKGKIRELSESEVEEERRKKEEEKRKKEIEKLIQKRLYTLRPLSLQYNRKRKINLDNIQNKKKKTVNVLT